MWALLRPFFAARIGEPGTNAIETRMRDTGAFLGAPQTFVAEIARLASAPGALTPEQAADLSAALPAIGAELDAARSRDQAQATHPRATSLAAALRNITRQLGVPNVVAATDPLFTPADLASA